MNLLHTPWMKKKLEVIYNKSINGNLYIMYQNKITQDYTSNTTIAILNLLEDYNITIDINNRLYLYLPFKLNLFLKNLIINMKSLYKNHINIVLCGYKDELESDNEKIALDDVYTKYPELKNSIDYLLFTDKSKCYEIFTALYDTQGIYISPYSSHTISCVVDNPLSNIETTSCKHISFVMLDYDKDNKYYFDSYVKGLTNQNNNFNYYL